MKSNDFVVKALQSPLHVLMDNTMLITVTGRKTGRKITLPVNYYRDGTTLWILSSRDRTWWKNLVPGSGVGLHLNGQDCWGFGEAILEETAVASQLVEYVKRLPMAARSIGLRIDDGTPNAEDLARLSKERLFIRVCVQQ